jgi:hypothetical protein
MVSSDSVWRSLVVYYAAAQEELRLSVSGIMELNVRTLESADVTGPVAHTVDRVIEQGDALEAYLADRIREDPEAQVVLGAIASYDFLDAALLDHASEEPEPVHAEEAAEIAQLLHPPRVGAELLGVRPFRGGQDSPVLDKVEASCEQILDAAWERGSALAKELAGAVTVDQVLDGVQQVIGGAVAELIDELRNAVGVLKKKVLDLIAAGVSKVAKLLGLDPEKVKEHLANLWEKAQSGAGDWAADLLGRKQTLERWTAWLGTAPPPGQSAVDASLGKVDASTENHEDHLEWANRAIWAFGKAGKFATHVKPAGPLVVIAVAAALGGWVTWIAWDHLEDVERAVP